MFVLNAVLLWTAAAGYKVCECLLEEKAHYCRIFKGYWYSRKVVNTAPDYGQWLAEIKFYTARVNNLPQFPRSSQSTLTSNSNRSWCIAFRTLLMPMQFLSSADTIDVFLLYLWLSMLTWTIQFHGSLLGLDGSSSSFHLPSEEHCGHLWNVLRTRFPLLENHSTISGTLEHLHACIFVL
jgi:hypothetical protein